MVVVLWCGGFVVVCWLCCGDGGGKGASVDRKIKQMKIIKIKQ